jgi:cytoskeletal protein CcmA (bactofilin family)
MNKSIYLLAASVAVLAASPALAQSQDVSMSGITVDYSGDVTGDGDFSGATVDVSGSFGGDLEVSGASVEADVEVGDDLEISGGAVDIRGSVGGDAEISGGAIDINLTVAGRSDISGGAIDVYSGSVFTGDTEISVGAMDFAGHAMASLSIRFGDLDFTGRADEAVDFEGNNREGIFRRRDRSEIEISGVLNAGGTICAHEVRFREGAEVNGPLTVHADEEPDYAAGFDASNISFVLRERERCRDDD